MGFVYTCAKNVRTNCQKNSENVEVCFVTARVWFSWNFQNSRETNSQQQSAADGILDCLINHSFAFSG